MYKNNCYFLRVPGFDVQNPQGDSQPSLTPFQGDITHSIDFPGYQACIWHIHTYVQHSYT